MRPVQQVDRTGEAAWLLSKEAIKGAALSAAFAALEHTFNPKHELFATGRDLSGFYGVVALISAGFNALAWLATPKQA